MPTGPVLAHQPGASARETPGESRFRAPSLTRRVGQVSTRGSTQRSRRRSGGMAECHCPNHRPGLGSRSPIRHRPQTQHDHPIRQLAREMGLHRHPTTDRKCGIYFGTIPWHEISLAHRSSWARTTPWKGCRPLLLIGEPPDFAFLRLRKPGG